MTPETKNLDRAVVRAASRIRVLSSIAWGPELQEPFLASWRAGRPELPRPGTEPRDLSSEISTLEDLASRCDPEDPRELFIADSARSYGSRSTTTARRSFGISDAGRMTLADA